MAVNVDGSTIAAGAYRAEFGGNSDQGAGYVFVRPATGWTNTSTFAVRLNAIGGGAGDYLGTSVAMSADANSIAVGAPYADIGSNNSQGATYVFVRPPVVYVPESDYHLQYDGWLPRSDVNANGGTFRWSSTAGETVSLSFTGSAVTWVTITGEGMGKAQTLIDGVDMGTVDLYSASTVYRVKQQFTGLTEGPHTIVVQVTGEKNPSSWGTLVAIDAFAYTSAGVVTVKQENWPVVQYNNWIGRTAAEANGGAYRVNSSTGVVKLEFMGDRINWITAKGPMRGQAEVFIDGVSRGIVDLYQATAEWQVAIPFTGLGSWVHTIEVRPLGTKNPLSGGTTVTVDAVKGPILLGGWPVD